MIQIAPPWQLATPIGDAECHLFDPGGPDDVSRFLCTINKTGEFWWFTQRDVRRNTCITDGRSKVTPFSAATMKRYRPIRLAAEKL